MSDGPLDDFADVITGDGTGEGYIEVRYRYAGGMRTRFYPAQRSHRVLERLVLRVGAMHDLYVGCALRRAERGDRDHIGQAWTLWAECDGPESRQQLDAFAMAPSLLVASGTPGNLHAYWALDEPIDAGTVEDTNRRLAAAVGGDPVCYDAARILRPPGSLNHKHTPPLPVRQIGSRGPACRLGELLRHLPVVEPPATSGPRDENDDPLLAIKPSDYVARLTGQRVGRDSKVACPFHDDRTPSLHAYPNAAEGWFCFGCRRGGSIYDMAAELWGLGTRGQDFVTLAEQLRRLF